MLVSSNADIEKVVKVILLYERIGGTKINPDISVGLRLSSLIDSHFPDPLHLERWTGRERDTVFGEVPISNWRKIGRWYWSQLI